MLLRLQPPSPCAHCPKNDGSSRARVPGRRLSWPRRPAYRFLQKPSGRDARARMQTTVPGATRFLRLPARNREGKGGGPSRARGLRSEEHTSELQSLMRISYAVFCLKKKKTQTL